MSREPTGADYQWTEKNCVHIDKFGKRCRAYHTKTSKLCFMHDPARREFRRQVCSLAGRRSRPRGYRQRVAIEEGNIVLPEDIAEQLPDRVTIKVETTEDLQALMNRVLTLAFSGHANPQLINAVTGALRAARSILETSLFEQRLRELERQHGVDR